MADSCPKFIVYQISWLESIKKISLGQSDFTFFEAEYSIRVYYSAKDWVFQVCPLFSQRFQKISIKFSLSLFASLTWNLLLFLSHIILYTKLEVIQTRFDIENKTASRLFFSQKKKHSKLGQLCIVSRI